MTIKTTIEANSPEEWREAVLRLAAAVEGFAPTVAEEAPAPEPTAEPTAEPVPEPEPATKLPTKEDVRIKLTGLVQAGHRDEVMAILQEVGASRLSDVPEDKLAEVMERAAAIK